VGLALLGAAGLFLLWTGNASSPVDPEEGAHFPALKPKSGGELVLLPAGRFTMGDPNGRPDATPHEVEVSPFYIDRYPVTQELYEIIRGVNPSKRKGKKHPVEQTQWTDAVRFCNECSARDGLTPCYDLKTWACNFEANGYRLPTEAEWEYACRAGSRTKYGCGDDAADLVRFAWFKPHSGGKTHPVGEKLPNRWGLYDMHGNVWQWCQDYYGATYYRESPRKDPRGPATGTTRVLRGGAWDSTPEKCGAAYRFQEFPVYSDACFGADSYGFRRVRKAGEAPGAESAPAHRARPGAQARAKEDQPDAEPRGEPDGAKINRAQLKGTIVFVSDRSGTLKIWRMQASGKDPRQLTRGAHPEADPKFSPDGKRILFTSLRGGFPEIWVMNRDGSGPRFVTKGSQGSWSPDGKKIVFIRDNQAYVRQLASGSQHRVTPESWQRCGVPTWSPDGKRLAVASRHMGTIGIFLLRADGREIRPLKTPAACCTPQWSTDGKKILCQTVQGHIHEAGVEGEDWEQLTFGADVQHDARYSPDGSMIVFCRAPSPKGPWQICVSKRDGDELDFVRLTEKGSNSLPDWHAPE
jgi:formylglycine-generating enzyme required for sulfatase activity